MPTSSVAGAGERVGLAREAVDREDEDARAWRRAVAVTRARRRARAGSSIWTLASRSDQIPLSLDAEAGLGPRPAVGAGANGVRDRRRARLRRGSPDRVQPAEIMPTESSGTDDRSGVIAARRPVRPPAFERIETPERSHGIARLRVRSPFEGRPRSDEFMNFSSLAARSRADASSSTSNACARVAAEGVTIGGLIAASPVFVLAARHLLRASRRSTRT